MPEKHDKFSRLLLLKERFIEAQKHRPGPRRIAAMEAILAELLSIELDAAIVTKAH